MNGDPYRTPQPADRRVINRSGQAPQRAEEQSQLVQDEHPRTAPRSSGSHRSGSGKDTKSSKGLIWTIAIVLLVIVIGLVGWFAWSNAKNASTGVDSSRYQAVFLVNGQIYFGKLQDFNDTSFKLTNIYYPQAQSTGEDGAETSTQNASSGIQLIKLGDEVHGPESEMFISKEQVLYYENLKADSKVTQLIQQNEK